METFDHDFGSAGEGKLIPHGVYDVVNHHAHIHLNASHDTSELCCDSVALWWEQAGRAAHPQAKRLLVLGDGGGSNSATHYLFKEDLQGLANRLGLEIRVAHYPPYCSKHNPIYGSATEVREGIEAWYESGINTLIVVPSSTRGGQMAAFQELIDAVR